MLSSKLFSDNEKMAKGLNTNKNWIDNVLNEFKDIETINNSLVIAQSLKAIKIIECCYKIITMYKSI
jgi:ligand-binding sensor protein